MENKLQTEDPLVILAMEQIKEAYALIRKASSNINASNQSERVNKKFNRNLGMASTCLTTLQDFNKEESKKK